MLIEREKGVARELQLQKSLQHETILKLHLANRKVKNLEEQLEKRDQDALQLKERSEHEIVCKVTHTMLHDARDRVSYR
jgi:hypothetical protein